MDLRFAYRLWSFTVDPGNLVFGDETGMHLGFTRLYGRAPKGERLYCVFGLYPGDSHPSTVGWGNRVDG